MLVYTMREQSCDGEVRRRPGVEAAGLEVAIPGQQIAKQGVRLLGGVKASVERRRAPAPLVGCSDAGSADDVGVGERGEEAEIDRERCPFRVGPARGRLIEKAEAAIKNIFEIGRKLMRDAIAVRRLGHGLS